MRVRAAQDQGLSRRDLLQAGAGAALALSLGPAAARAQAQSGAGQPRVSAGGSTPTGFLPCDGRVLERRYFPELAGAIGHHFGGGGETFRIPDLGGSVAVGTGKVGEGQLVLGAKGDALIAAERPGHAAGLGLTYLIDTGKHPTAHAMVGELRPFTYHHGNANHWLTANGAHVAGEAHPALASVIGPRFGGTSRDPQLPDLSHRAVVGTGHRLSLGGQIEHRAIGAHSAGARMLNVNWSICRAAGGRS